MMKQKIKRFVPTLEDKEWMIEMYNKLGEGSRLITDVAIYQMSNDTLVLREINKKAYELGFDDLSIEKEIEKMRATAAMVEVKFFDARPTRSNWMKNEKKNKKKKSIEEMTASEIGEKLLDELKAQGPKKGTKGNIYITRAGGSGAKK